MDFRDGENPYESPVVATLVERPATKRSPSLAAVFLIADSPFLIGSGILFHLVATRGPAIAAEPEGTPLAVGYLLASVVSGPFWLVALICLKELIQAARRR